MGSFFKFIIGVGAVITLSIVGSLLYLIFHAVTKNVMNARKKDFAIFRSIGTNKIVLARLVLVEQIIVSLIGFSISMIILTLVRNNVTFIRSALIYMELFDFILLVLIIMLIGVMIGLKFNKKVFNMSVIETLTQSRGE
jgi:ABC-type antimicrobial peptide transport system permease subunit